MIEEVLQIERDTGTNFWLKAFKMEMRNVRVAFDVCKDGKIPVGFKEIKGHLSLYGSRSTDGSSEGVYLLEHCVA